MHYTGTIWRPPYEASSLLLEATIGCTHHKCKFCTLYDDLCFDFKMASLKDIEADLKEVRDYSKISYTPQMTRCFLTGANPFVLKYDRLIKIAELIHNYLPSIKSIGCFCRLTDIALKSNSELYELKKVGYDGLTIGIETGDDDALLFMNKGYTSKDIIIQCSRLDQINFNYNFFYLTGISGANNGQNGALATSDICNQLHPRIIGASMLTVYPSSRLYQEIQLGHWKEETELEKYHELKTLIEHLDIPVEFGAAGASNAIPIHGYLPKDKDSLLHILNKIIDTISEEDLRYYRINLPHL